MPSFGERKRAAISNNRAWKAMMTNYYIEDNFRKAGGIDHNLDCLFNW